MNTVDILCPGNSTCDTHDLKTQKGTLLKRQLEICPYSVLIHVGSTLQCIHFLDILATHLYLL